MSLFRINRSSYIVDWLIIKAFIGPFILTTSVVTFILLIQQMMRYVDELLGKGLSYAVFGELLFYYSLHIVPLGMPLGILLSSLITFGNLGEHQELTALKGAGISLIRVLSPIFLFTVVVSIGSFFFNDRIVPEANLKAYSLLWDIRQKSPTLSIKEGTFYDGLPGYSIKINKKYPDGQLIKDIMIYDHTSGLGNRELILADSGRMYTIKNERYLVLELFDGANYQDQVQTRDGNNSREKFITHAFEKSQIVFSLSSFDMDTTDKRLFKGHRIMKNVVQLAQDIDSLKKTSKNQNQLMRNQIQNIFLYHNKRETPNKDSASKKTNKLVVPVDNSPAQLSKIDTVAGPIRTIEEPASNVVYSKALSRARTIRNAVSSRIRRQDDLARQARDFSVEFLKKFTLAFACISMFLIGAPLGSIIKRGGLGIPVLISIIFFIVFYVISIFGEKWVKEGMVSLWLGMWASNIFLLSFGFFFLKQAKNDSPLLDSDFYYVLQDQLLGRFIKKKT